MKKVAILMGSKSDAPVVAPAVKTLKAFGVEATVRVLSAHRTPGEAMAFATGAADAGYGAMICCAGKAAHLAGVCAAHTVLPVIGLPIKSSFMDGIDSLLSTVQMPAGIPVATVGVNAAENAALLAVQILALSDEGLTAKLKERKAKMTEDILRDDKAIDEIMAGLI